MRFFCAADDLTSTVGAVPMTSTVSVRPGCSWASTVIVCPSCRRASWLTVRNPLNSTFTVYVPGGSAGKR